MSEQDEVQFSCIGCGTYHSAAAEFCAGCGHRFAGSDVIAPVRVVLPPRASDNPYEAPRTLIVSRGTFRIGSMLTWIAVIAVCLAAFRENIALGILTMLSMVPATIRTSIEGGIRRARGREFALGERVGTFLITLFATWAIFFSSVIAFLATCFPVGLATRNLWFAGASGVTGAIISAVWLTRVFMTASQENARRENEIRYR